jgi:hypothetical protein
MTYRTQRTYKHSFPSVLLCSWWHSLPLAREPILAPPKIERARDLGIPSMAAPGKFNAITDVPGVEVGYTTLISGEGKLGTWQRPGSNGRDRDSAARPKSK